MRDEVLRIVSCWLCVCALATGVPSESHADDLRQHLLQREQKLASYTFEWHLTAREIPQNNTTSLPSDSRFLPLHPARQYTGTMAIVRRGNLTYVRQAKPARGLPIGEPIVRHTVYQGSMAYSFSQRPKSIAPQMAHGIIAEVWKTKGQSVRHRASPPIAGAVLPELLAMLAGFSPAELYQSGVPKAAVTKGVTTVLSISDMENRRFVDATLDSRRDFCPVEINLVHGETVRRFRATRWLRINDTYIPAEVSEESVSPFLRTTTRWLLKSVHESKGQQLPSQIPKGAMVRDYRLTHVEDENSLDRSLIVSYPLSDRLPSEKDLNVLLEKARLERSIQAKQPRSVGWYRLIPPLLLIAVGILWYWRLKRAEGRKAQRR